MDVAGSTSCTLCPSNAYNPATGATRCYSCGIGQRHSPNHTTCMPCASIVAGLTFVQYFEPGCALRCQPGVSYLRTSVYAPGGCGNCSTVTVPVGTYADAAVCTTAHRCTNAPSNAYYTGASPTRGVSACTWACNAGFTLSLGTCQPCAYAAGTFNATLHRPTSGCAYTCKPLRYIDVALRCDQWCNDLLVDLLLSPKQSKLIFLATRIREYTTIRPRYIQGVCGSAEVVPNAHLPFLRRGRYAYLSPTPAASVSLTCGNALLDVGEACDDGNGNSGDGCSRTCTVEAGLWDCDLIGVPCLPQCGWTTATLSGFVLPAASSCSKTYYDLTAMSSVPQQKAWMAANLIPCDCGGNAQRMVPYANCTAENLGCRLCATGQYHDDALARCVPCGSACAPGFTATSTPVCSTAVSTSAVLSQLRAAAGTAGAMAAAQLSLGCAPCPAPYGGLATTQVRYIDGCSYACFRTSTAASATLPVCRPPSYIKSNGGRAHTLLLLMPPSHRLLPYSSAPTHVATRTQMDMGAFTGLFAAAIGAYTYVKLNSQINALAQQIGVNLNNNKQQSQKKGPWNPSYIGAMQDAFQHATSDPAAQPPSYNDLLAAMRAFRPQAPPPPPAAPAPASAPAAAPAPALAAPQEAVVEPPPPGAVPAAEIPRAPDALPAGGPPADDAPAEEEVRPAAAPGGAVGAQARFYVPPSYRSTNAPYAARPYNTRSYPPRYYYHPNNNNNNHSGGGSSVAAARSSSRTTTPLIMLGYS